MTSAEIEEAEAREEAEKHRRPNNVQCHRKIINVFKSPASEKYEASYKVQILGDSPLVDGQVKKEMLTLNVPLAVFNSLQGRNDEEVTLPIGFYVKIMFWSPSFPSPRPSKRWLQASAWGCLFGGPILDTKETKH